MLEVTAHTPAWLSRPSTGFQVFQAAEKKAASTLSNGYGKKVEHRGPTRTAVNRGTEVFFVVDNEIRWTDLVALKEAGEKEKEKHSRVLKAPIAGKIQQLVVSPLGDYMAIATSHTVHIAVLPTRFETESPIRLKTFQLGPTAHVLEQAPLASVLWHPLGALGSCLVTLATDACVRVWELNRENRHSFDEPALALDLKKLANASSYGEDMRASVYGTSKGFSPDLVEMEVAAACFGGIGSSDEFGWSAATLWVAMTEGDIYALCPLLPSKWQPTTSTIPSLSTSVVSKASILLRDPGATEEERRQAVQQQKWLADIDAQEPQLELLPGGLDTVEIYQRPTHPPAVPKLQGPFHLGPDPDIDDISDILAIAPKLDDELHDDYDEDEYGEPISKDGLSIGLLCLLTRSGTVHICLDTNGVEAKWLPSRRIGFQAPLSLSDESSMLVLESIELGSEDATDGWPALTPIIANRYLALEPLYEAHPAGRYSFLVTQSSGVDCLILTPWIQNLEDELSGPSDTGASFRIGLMHESEHTIVTPLISIANPHPTTPAAISLIDSDLSHFIFTLSLDQPQSASIELPLPLNPADSFAPSNTQLLLPTLEVREPYLPPREFFTPTQLPSLVDQTLHSNSRLKRSDVTSHVRLSPATLQLLTEAHRILSDETSRLGAAAADLFRRCQRMQAELAEQVQRVSEIKERADDAGGKAKVEDRLRAVRERDDRLQRRVEAVKRKVAGLQGATASQREEQWGAEAKGVEQRLDSDLEERAKRVRELKEEMVARAKEVRGGSGGEDTLDDERVPSEVRRKKLEQVMVLLERESALVDAVSERLGRLSGLGR